jgi:hypothetical protein
MPDENILEIGASVDLAGLQSGLDEAAAQTGKCCQTMSAAFSSMEKTSADAAVAGANIRRQCIAQEAKQFDSFCKAIDSGFRTAIKGVILGTQTLSQAFGRMRLEMVAGFAASLEKMLTHWIAHELKMLAFHQTVEAAKTTASVRGVATRNAADAAGGLKEVMHAAAAAAAKAYSALAGIPVVGPFIAPAGAAAAFAGVMAFESLASAQGGWAQVPQPTLTMLHTNEMVLPANIASGFRSMLSAPGFSFEGGAGSRGSAMPGIMIQPQIRAWSPADVASAARQMSAHIAGVAETRVRRIAREYGVGR